MKISRRAQIAIAVGWFVLLDILLRTSDSVISNITNLSSGIRGVLYLFASNSSALIAIVGLAVLISLIVLAITYLLRAWTNTIALTRQLVFFFFEAGSENKSEPEAVSNTETNLLDNLFGKNILTSKNGYFWNTLSNLFRTWVVLLIIAILIAIVSSISRY